MKTGILQTKSENFSVRMIRMKKHLQKVMHEYEISNQVGRSGTSIGANIAEAFCAESDADFIHKLQIALKEANETRHWLLVLYRSEYITQIQYDSVFADCEELIRLLVFTIKKRRQAQNK